MHRYDGAMTRHDPPSTLSARDRYVPRNLLYLDHVLCGCLLRAVAKGAASSLECHFCTLVDILLSYYMLILAATGAVPRSQTSLPLSLRARALHTADLRATGSRTSTANLRQLELCGVRSRLSVCLASFFYLLYR
jgi:hypothetical protein